MTPILKASGIQKSFPGVVALANGELSVNPGEVHGLVGENGAGKSTLVSVICGATPPDAGSIEYLGEPFAPRSPREAYNAGIRVVFQHLSLIPFLTVTENLYVGRELSGGLGFLNRGAMRKRVDATLQELGFAHIGGQDRIIHLSTSQRFLVEVAKAVLYAPKLLIMDEPTAALNDAETELLFSITRNLRDEGSGIVWITHRLEELAQITDRITVMRDGAWVETVDSADVTRDAIISSMTGRKITAEALPPPLKAGAPVYLRTSGVSSDDGLHDLGIEVHSGEVVGIGGLAGSGIEEVGRLLFGVTPLRAGTVEILGRTYRRGQLSPGKLSRSGVFYLPGDRMGEGIFDVRPVLENTSVSALPQLSNFGFLRRGEERSSVRGFIERLGIKTRSAGQVIDKLSGGNQQKVLFARGMLTKADVFILEEPTQGVDVGAKADIYKVIHELAENGAAVLVISTDTRELLTICHRLLAVHDGRVIASFNADEVTEDRLVSAYFGQIDERETA